MNKVIKTMVMGVAASGMLLASSAMAADQKIGVVNFQEVMSKIPQTAALMQSLEAEFKDEKAVITQLEKDIKYYQEKLKRDGSLMSAKEKEELNVKVKSLFQEYQVKGKALQDKATQRQNQETNKIIALVRQAVDKIAVKQDFDLVLSQQAVVYAKPDASLTDVVVEQVSKLK
ncbi:OmpH family outer membrane protein [Colwellia psychrerythraea]|uniref:Outer membrane chaperone Skp (OmpH) n=1 Tax=Colwellia psychrerythraea TaxID=28229 RepID=A0A099KLJ0_COLPS|nr:OmpH family outer membrane protein [Colwellia psychrerythraea]KGJ91326.1 outer membrane chaperone Skp (OmpH) [Colwellia psychrerythraea]